MIVIWRVAGPTLDAWVICGVPSRRRGSRARCRGRHGPPSPRIQQGAGSG